MNTEFWQLRAASQNYFDAHQMTTSLTNRIKALARAGHYEPVLDAQLADAQEARKRIGTELDRLYRQLAPPAIVKFQADTAGLGDRYMAQLVGSIGDFRTYTEAWWEEAPADDSHAGSDSQGAPDLEDGSLISAEDQKPREKRVLVTGETLTCGVRDIWTYCGHGDPAARRRKGQTQEQAFKAGSPLAKTIVHMMADFAVRLNGEPDKNGRPRPMTPYRPLYERAKAEALATHEKWTPMHAHNHAVRLVGKAILKDVWRVQHGQEPAYGARTPWTPRVKVSA